MTAAKEIPSNVLSDMSDYGTPHPKIHPVLHRFCLKEDGLTARSEP